MSLIAKMVAFEPNSRFQTPMQMVEAIQACRAAMQEANANQGPRSRNPSGQRTLFALEAREVLKDAIRDKFKERGFRVLLSSDPDQAVKRYQQQPYHALIVNAGSTGREGLHVFNRLLKESDQLKIDLAAVLILDQKQTDLEKQAITHPRGAVMYLPLKMKELIEKVQELAPPDDTPTSDVD
jgi:serine/threonine-protein kinase